MLEIGKKYLILGFIVENLLLSLRNLNLFYGISITKNSYFEPPVRINYASIL